MAEPVLAVDFGTSASSAALVADGRVALLKEPTSGLYSWPSAVAADGAGLLVGTAAERRKRADPTAYRAEFKRDLGQADPVPLGERAFQAEDLVTAVLGVFRDQAAQLRGGPAGRLVLTVPAAYGAGDPRRALMVAAGERAGFAEVELLPEPVAAAWAPVAGPGFADGDVVLVYDLGGGTFDAALVRHGREQRHEVLGHAALDDAGGRDVDALIAAHLRGSGDELAAALAPPGLERPARLRLGLQVADFVRAVKHQLTDVTEVEDFVTAVAPPYRLRRGDLGTLVAPLLARTVDCCADLLRRTGARPAAVLLVGGASRMPAVAEAVRAHLGLPVRRAEDPDLAVVQGAAVLAARPRPAVEAEVADRTRLQWAVPGGFGTLVRHLVGPGGDFDAGVPLALLRDDGDALVELVAPPLPGRVERWHAAERARVASGETLAETAPPARAPHLLGLPEVVRVIKPYREADALATSPDGRLIATAGVVAQVWSATGERQVELPRGRWFRAVAFGPNGRILATADEDGTARVWDAGTGQQLAVYRREGQLWRLALRPDGVQFAVAGVNREVTVVDTAGGAVIRHLLVPRGEFGFGALAYSPDGTALVVAGEEVSVWDAATGEARYTYRHPGVTGAEWSPCGRWLATLGKPMRRADQRVHVDTVQVHDAATGRLVHEWYAGPNRGSIAFGGGGAWLAVAGPDSVDMYDPPTGELLGRFDLASTRAMTFTADGLHLVRSATDDAVQVLRVGELR
ncbi:Hsp70 family protein [Dactylosporangium sp. AC04546]|uniref:Hsp70 family protein n=1 Tax=Dactylosporangium sp. AC04546 TaxID=2862460 RepID=UPI001EDE6A64|nr:Hsp70 family protein [Dactylosporangium sp. AC04546]WVK79853.1 Hsp70 family protein [Dactylosporangium sp. AC04546]